MPKNINKYVEGKSSVAAGAATYIGDLSSPTVQVSGITTATVQVQESVDGATWTQVGSDFTGDGQQAISKQAQYVRLKTTAYTSGTILGQVSGAMRASDQPAGSRVVAVPASVAAGAATYIGDLTSVHIEVEGTFSATTQLQGSMDGSAWKQVGTDITAVGEYAVSDPWNYLRFNTTVYVSGTPKAHAAGTPQAAQVVRTMNVKDFIAAPTTAAIVSTSGAAGSQGYKIQGVNADGQFGAACVEVTCSDGPTTLDSTHYNTVTCDAMPGAATYKVYRTTGGVATGYIGSFAAGDEATGLRDNGLTASGTDLVPATGTSVTAGQGSALAVADMTAGVKMVVFGTFVQTVDFEGSMDGSNWKKIGSSLTASGASSAASAVVYVRANMKANTSGAVKACAVGAQ